MPSRIRARTLRGLAFVVLSGAAAGPARGTLDVVGPAEVLTRHVVRRGDTSFLRVEGREWALITDPSSPRISALGDGAFHPMAQGEVVGALRDLAAVCRPLPGRVLILPYPRAATLESSQESGTIFLSPGIRPVHREHVHATVAHEVGHLVQQLRAPEGSLAWEEYRALRGLDDPRFREHAPHRDRPREIFAEDFRILFGGVEAVSSAPHENPLLAAPQRVAGLREWFEEMLRGPLSASLERPGPSPRVFPNPFPAATGRLLEIRYASSPRVLRPPTADVYETTGRRVRSLAGAVSLAGDVVFRWDGRDGDGRPVASGVYLVRWRDDPRARTARVHLLH